jgi:hypothetical protein
MHRGSPSRTRNCHLTWRETFCVQDLRDRWRVPLRARALGVRCIPQRSRSRGTNDLSHLRRHRQEQVSDPYFLRGIVQRSGRMHVSQPELLSAPVSRQQMRPRHVRCVLQTRIHEHSRDSAKHARWHRQDERGPRACVDFCRRPRGLFSASLSAVLRTVVAQSRVRLLHTASDAHPAESDVLGGKDGRERGLFRFAARVLIIIVGVSCGSQHTTRAAPALFVIVMFGNSRHFLS